MLGRTINAVSNHHRRLLMKRILVLGMAPFAFSAVELLHAQPLWLVGRGSALENVFPEGRRVHAEPPDAALGTVQIGGNRNGVNLDLWRVSVSGGVSANPAGNWPRKRARCMRSLSWWMPATACLIRR